VKGKEEIDEVDRGGAGKGRQSRKGKEGILQTITLHSETPSVTSGCLLVCLLKFSPIHNKFVVESWVSGPSIRLSTDDP
jgi:hypothetical protein